MSTLSAAQWMILDNLLHGWSYWTNLDRDIADKAYLWCVNNEYIKDGKITDSGKTVRLLNIGRRLENE